MATDKRFQEEVVKRLTSISDSVVGLDKKVDLHIQATQYELKGIRVLDEQQNKLIDQHIEGVKSLRSIIEKHEQEDVRRFDEAKSASVVRLDALETPKKWWKQTIVYLLKIGAFAGAMAGVAELWYYLAHMK